MASIQAPQTKLKALRLLLSGKELTHQALLLSGLDHSAKLDEAQAMVEAFLTIEPKNADALSLLGDVLMQQADLPPAID